MNVSEFMTKTVTTCSEERTVGDAAEIMIENGISVLPIVNSENKLVGILTESDFVGRDAKIPHALASIINLFGQVFYFDQVETLYKRAKVKKIKEVMTKNPTTVRSNASLTELVKLMNSKNLKRLPVVDREGLVGIVTRKDLIKAFESL